ncbi:hypothetical protein V1508DRAFT_402002 [Lipomyces doorenjongii]|uniref:uncharacterized protein n=1 Tax=Lipomyces doorenjongii TaxID=383834 RepID=UPI0034CE3CD0
MTSSSRALHLEDTEDQYQRALNFLVTNEPEQCLEVQLPLHKYEELERYADSLYGEIKYPYVDYNTNTSTVTIYTAPAPLHGMVSAQLQYLIHRGAEMALIQHNKPEIARRLHAYGESSDRPVFGGYNSRISKVPDGGLVYFLTREEVLTVAIETGLSEKYEKLQKDAYLWVKGAHCQMAITVCLQEQPNFKYPPKAVHTVSLEAYDVFKTKMADTLAENPFGPYIYDGHTWFGQLAEAFAIVYKRADDGSITQSEPYRLVQDGTFLVQGEELDTGITLGDVLPRDEKAAIDIREVPIKFVTEDIRALLMAGARRTASVRFRALVAE